jgi:hypothetical protein
MTVAATGSGAVASVCRMPCLAGMTVSRSRHSAAGQYPRASLYCSVAAYRVKPGRCPYGVRNPENAWQEQCTMWITSHHVQRIPGRSTSSRRVGPPTDPQSQGPGISRLALAGAETPARPAQTRSPAIWLVILARTCGSARKNSWLSLAGPG